MNHRPELIERATDYLKSQKNERIEATILSPEMQAELRGLKSGLVEGRKQGKAIAETRYRQVEWQRLTRIAIAGGFIGSVLAFILAGVVITAIYLITTPHL